jgi:nucleoside 2-deoxyribosyltransferase
MPKFYLAGPDVFRQDPLAHFKEMRAVCLKYGCEGVSPLDTELEVPTADAIFKVRRPSPPSPSLVLAH